MDVECGGCGEEVGEAQFLVQSIGGSFKTRKLVYSTSCWWVRYIGMHYPVPRIPTRIHRAQTGHTTSQAALSASPTAGSYALAIQLGSRVRPLA